MEYMMKCYPEIKEKEEMRKIIGRYGLTGKQQVSPNLDSETTEPSCLQNSGILSYLKILGY